MISKYMLLLISILFILMNACASKELSIVLKNNKFEGKDKIEFKVCNNKSNEPLEFFGVVVEKREDDKWNLSRNGYDLGCYCNTICDFRTPHKLNKGQFENYSIDLSDLECDEKKAKGEYRFSVFTFYSKAESDYPESSKTYSESFFVK